VVHGRLPYFARFASDELFQMSRIM